MPLIQSRIHTQSEEYRSNAGAMRALVSDLRSKVAHVAQGGGNAARDRHTARGKMLPRERVQNLLDPGTPFLELSPLAAWDMYESEAPGAGIITGIANYFVSL